MDEVRLEKLIEETLSTMDPVEVPKDLHFDAAKIMRLARMEEEAEAERDEMNAMYQRIFAGKVIVPIGGGDK